ncbi:hypothetical protein CXG81DRAFT_28595 [Caulochytrium protostelioides]|uniref:Nucleotide-sugar transporter n=1 Tax=Caulochytrium protostelioides TaxID=1555241 RepID=A0A4P9X2J8_9FUNG|nr:hypothetical protein CXG81DRAFT_28595 [Caulochytrium protostelioides]|eukprot:RKO98586.1 hypothetical protein CXG81DRAFT_28595 [Caulochytrium protostelioides]
MAADLSGPKEPTLFGVSLKWISLATLVIQNSMLVIVMRYSRTAAAARNDGTPPYLASTAVAMSELIKMVICIGVYVRAESQVPGALPITPRRVVYDVLGPNSDWPKMMVPAVLYLVQNNLQYLAVTMLDAATFQVTYQMKILTTAFFSVWMLNRPLSPQKWVSLVLLTFGIAMVQIPAGGKSDSSGSAAAGPGGLGARMVGLIAVTAACVLSGIAGVWFEKVLKGSKSSLWLRNLQLSCFSFVPGLVMGCMVMDGAHIREHGFFAGYTPWTCGAILCQALGGLIVAVVVKYADNILKGFATSLSIILSCVVSVYLFDFHVTTTFTLGAALVLYATHMYGRAPNVPPPTTALPYHAVPRA